MLEVLFNFLRIILLPLYYVSYRQSPEFNKHNFSSDWTVSSGIVLPPTFRQEARNMPRLKKMNVLLCVFDFI